MTMDPGGEPVSIIFRRLGPDEGPALRGLRLRSLADSPDAFGQTLQEAARRPMGEWHMEARRSAAGDAHAWFVARLGDADVGTVQGRRRRPDTLLVFSMWVDPGLRTAGVGRGLMDAIESWATGWGASTTLLWVYERNHGAISFYERLGFRVDGGGPDAEAGKTYAALAMRRPIRQKAP